MPWREGWAFHNQGREGQWTWHSHGLESQPWQTANPDTGVGSGEGLVQVGAVETKAKEHALSFAGKPWVLVLQLLALKDGLLGGYLLAHLLIKCHCFNMLCEGDQSLSASALGRRGPSLVPECAGGGGFS